MKYLKPEDAQTVLEALQVGAQHIDSSRPALLLNDAIRIMQAEDVKAEDSIPDHITALFDQLRPVIDYWTNRDRKQSLEHLDKLQDYIESQHRTLRGFVEVAKRSSEIAFELIIERDEARAALSAPAAPSEQHFTAQQVIDACADAEIPDSKCESLMIALHYQPSAAAPATVEDKTITISRDLMQRMTGALFNGPNFNAEAFEQIKQEAAAKLREI